jgi:hypothetical protein
VDAYAVYLHVDLLEAVPGAGEQRRLIMKFIRSLANNPYTKGDFQDKDASQRIRQIKIIGKYAVTYWLDAPVNTVMVVDVRPADK